jgi:hypothetical protein
VILILFGVVFIVAKNTNFLSVGIVIAHVTRRINIHVYIRTVMNKTINVNDVMLLFLRLSAMGQLKLTAQAMGKKTEVTHHLRKTGDYKF